MALTVFDKTQIPSIANLLSYRRPVLKYGSATTVTIETGINGTSGQAAVLFPDGALITDSTTGHITMTSTQVASLGGTPQGGLDTGTIANNTWYACYCCKANSGASMVLVASLNLPIQANFATLNSNFGTNGWVYLGLIRNGDQGTNSTGILNFVQYGNETNFLSGASAGHTGASVFPGFILSGTASATNLVFTYSTGTSGVVFPNNINTVVYVGIISASTGNSDFKDSGGTMYGAFTSNPGAGSFWRVRWPASLGVRLDAGSAAAMDIGLSAWTDAVLGVGSNPLL